MMEGRGDSAMEGGRDNLVEDMAVMKDKAVAEDEAVAEDKAMAEDKAVAEDKAMAEDKGVAEDSPPVFELEGPGPGLRRRFTLAASSGAVVPLATAVVPLATQIAGHGSENDGQRWIAGSLFLHSFHFSPICCPPSCT